MEQEKQPVQPFSFAKFAKKWAFRAGKAVMASLLAGLCLFVCVDLLYPLRARVSYSQTILSAEGETLRAYLADDDRWRIPVRLEEVSEDLKKAIVQKEDKYFYYHPGVNPVAIGRAVFNNLTEGRKTSGASTITMQVARLLEPKPRTYANKLFETFRAFQLELQYSKKEILELYFNLVPYGGNVEGVGSASLLFFGRPPDRLSLAQSVALSIVPNRPTSLALGRHNERIQAERDRWLRRFEAEGAFAADRTADALAEPLEARRRASPNFAPHLCERLHAQKPYAARLQTHIDLEKQRAVQRLVRGYVEKQRHYGIHNAAVVVIDNRTRGVVAYVGSADFGDDRHSGQVDGVRAVRSPGSALKPLVYALAFESGLYTPKRSVYDVPFDADGYAPENFDKAYRGRVSAEDALAGSLNVPAVKLLDQIGIENAINKLKAADFQQIARDEPKLGLSLALGGCGTRLEELAGLYAAFANGGQYAPLSYLQTDSSAFQSQLFGPATAYMIAQTLTRIERPDLPHNYRASPHVPNIAWKTGTSYGRRDAWSVGYNSRYTVGVWAGNFDGQGAHALTGAGVATPLLFRVFHLVDSEAAEEPFNRPDESVLGFRYVCSVSGRVPSDFCDHQVMDYFLPGVSDSQPCEHERIYFVSEDERVSYCGDCIPNVGYKRKRYPNYPPELLAYFRESMIPHAEIPPHEPSCTRVFKSGKPKIVSPADGNEYYALGDDLRLLLQCQAAPNVKNVYWYLNGEFLQKAEAAEKVFIAPPKGQLTISCTDDKGRNAQIAVKVF